MKKSLKNLLFKNRKLKSSSGRTLSLKTKGLLFFCTFLFIQSKAQINLVPNSSFEVYSICPTSSGQINYAIPWQGNPTGTTTDYFNSCSSSMGIPNHGSDGFQYAHTGNAYSAIWVYDGVGMDYREYLQTQLIDSLKPNICYKVSFFINLYNGSQYATNNMACHFSNILISSTGTGNVLSLSSQITSLNNFIINDTLNWVNISGIYSATGGEKYITIGNFYNNANTDTIITNYGTNPSAYYYIDDVSVIPIDSIPGGMPAYAGNDANVIPGDSVFIGQEISNLDCNWYNASGSLIASNTSGIYVQPISDTYYVVEQNLCGSITYDTVNVNVSGVGINENKWSKSVNLFPNPNSGDFKIELKNIEDKDILLELFDITGCLIHSQSLQLTGGISNFKLNISNGVYLVHVTNILSNEKVVKKLVIQK
jgi:hypothetical protein